MINYIFFAISLFCISYTFLVNKKLNNLKNFIEEFKSSFYQFNTSADKISQHIADFKDINKHSSHELEQKVTHALLLINELQIINDSAVQQIEILEKKLDLLKSTNKPNPAHGEKYLLYKTQNTQSLNNKPNTQASAHAVKSEKNEQKKIPT